MNNTNLEEKYSRFMEKERAWASAFAKKKEPLFIDRLFYIPPLQSNNYFLFPSFFELFGNSHPVIIEFCSGNGEWVLERALETPNWNWVAVEKKFHRAKKIWSKVQKTNLLNICTVHGDARIFTENYLQKESVFQVFINFPDPWPKRRHANNRLIQEKFIQILTPILQSNGKMIFVTDDSNYRDQMIEVMKKSQVWNPIFPYPYFKTDWSRFGTSFFDRLWREKGKTIYYLCYCK